MYRRGAFHILVLLLVVLVGSAVAQQLTGTGTQILVNGVGPHAVGGESDRNVQFFMRGSYTPAVGSPILYGFLNRSTLNLVSSDTTGAYAASIEPTLATPAASVTYNELISLRVDAPVLSLGGGSVVNNASALKVGGAPTGATNNYALWVAGGLTRLDGYLRVAGNVQVDGNIAAKYQDVAEWVPSAQALEDGTVTIIDNRGPNRVVKSDKPYDTHVAGVVSAQPGVLLGEAGADKTKLAHSGRVKVKVDARYGAIAIGDLLVTSATPGYAMRSKPISVAGTEIHRPGTIIGKALEPLGTGQGEILVLLTLQ
jgi:hypothetical protein